MKSKKENDGLIVCTISALSIKRKIKKTGFAGTSKEEGKYLYLASGEELKVMMF